MSTKIVPFKVIKLDRRFTGYDFFEYAVDSTIYWDFVRYRNWCWATFGPSVEWEVFDKLVLSNDYQSAIEATDVSNSWAWQSAYQKRRIFLANQEALSHFLLTFG